MLNIRVIPSLNVRDGRVLNGARYSDLPDESDPVRLARRYEREGADEIVILDASATADGRLARSETIGRVRDELSIPLTVGGGVRTVDDAGVLLEAGADRVAVNTAAVERPALLHEISSRFGARCSVLALDAARHDANDGASELRGADPLGPRRARDSTRRRGRGARRSWGRARSCSPALTGMARVAGTIWR